ncbi:MAG: hypothetical protein RBT59_13125 [Arcobacteraceae bacterium]|jgi:hypothetical protein|nr:hypothetical protein [Arcobacteraceae bacterium]
MSSTKDIQYINLIKIEQNIKLDNQIFTNGKLLTAEQSIFLLENNKLSGDALFKIKILENEISHSFITAICEDTTQEIITKNTPKNKNNCEVVFDASHVVVLDKASVDITKSYYNNGHIDYLISPFTILHDEIILSPKQNSLNLFILNNTIYAIFLNEKKRVGYSCIQTLTPYADIKKSNFYTDEVVEQILYDEIYLLELGENITTILKNYYELSHSSNFCEIVNIFYVIKNLENKHLETLKTNLALDITYNPINIDDAVDTIVRRENIESYSFTKKRVKKSKYTIVLWFLIALITTMGAIYSFYFLQSSEAINTPAKAMKQQETQKIKEIELPNHVTTNRYHINLIIKIFDSIDDNSVLKEIQIAKNESTIIYDFKAINPFERALKPKLLKFYEHSENILTTENKGTFTSIISNINLLTKFEPLTKTYIPTTKETFLSTDTGKKGIEQLFNNNAVVKLLSSTDQKFVQYTYEVSTIFKTPIEFFDIIKLLEKQNYSIVLDYPIEFSQTNKGLEMNFRLLINQNKPQSLTK